MAGYSCIRGILLIPPDIIDKIRESVSLADYLARSVSLNRSGTHLKGLCPFHNERTPSFYVYPVQNRFHCYGCGKHGDIFTYMQEIEGHSFVEAAELLASRAGITLLKKGGDNSFFEQRCRPLLQTNEEALNFFVHNLTVNPAGRRAYRYLIDRGVHADSISNFRLGYALPQWEGLVRKMASRSFRIQTLLEAGLIREGKQRGKVYDYFRDRVIFPILNEKGDCAAFGGRILESGEPKYLNTPENPVFQKRDLLYGLYQARQEIRKRDCVYLVEGYLDVIGMHQTGFFNAVAPLGTSLTEEHLKRLHRYSGHLILLFDGDAAGRKAVFRSSLMIMDRGLKARVVLLPEGGDAFDLCRTSSRENVATKLKSGVALSDFVLNSLYRDNRPDSIEGKLDFLNAVFDFLQGFKERTVVDLMIRKASSLSGTDPEAALRDFYNRKERPVQRRRAPRPLQPAGQPVTVNSDSSFEFYLLRLTFLYDEFWEPLADIVGRGELVLEDSRAIYLYQLIVRLMGEGERQPVAGLIASIEIPWVRSCLEEDLRSGHFEMDRQVQFDDTLRTIRLKKLKERRKILSQEVNKLVLAGEQAKAMELEEQIVAIRKEEEAVMHMYREQDKSG